jgi:hypothetical protein
MRRVQIAEAIIKLSKSLIDSQLASTLDKTCEGIRHRSPGEKEKPELEEILLEPLKKYAILAEKFGPTEKKIGRTLGTKRFGSNRCLDYLTNPMDSREL